MEKILENARIIKEILENELKLKISEVNTSDDEMVYIIATKITFTDIKIKMFSNIDIFDDFIIINFFNITVDDDNYYKLDKNKIMQLNEHLKIGAFGTTIDENTEFLTFKFTLLIDSEGSFDQYLFKKAYILNLKNIVDHSLNLLGWFYERKFFRWIKY